MRKLLWNGYAHLYDGLLELQAYQDMIQTVTLLSDVAGCRALDVGCGTGNVIQSLTRAGADHVLGVDISVNMLKRARRKLAADIDAGRVDLTQGDAVQEMRRLPEGCVDRITAVNAVYALGDRPAFFHECRRLLSPGGFLLVSHPTRHGSGPIVRDQLRRRGVRGTLRPRLLGIATVDLVIDAMARGGLFEMASVSTLAAEAAEAGMSRTQSLGRCYGGAQDGINELVMFSEQRSTGDRSDNPPGQSSRVIDLSSPARWRGSR